MSEETGVSPGLMVAEDKQMDGERRKSEEGSFIESQMMVMMTGDKVSEVMTPSKEKRENELNLSELGNSPLESFQSLQSSQGSEGDKMIPEIPLVGETRVLRFEDTLLEEDHRNLDLIYESLLLEGRAGNLTNLTLEMVLAEKPLRHGCKLCTKD